MMFKITYCYDGKRTPSKKGDYCCIMRTLEGDLFLASCEWRLSLVKGEFCWFITDGFSNEEIFPYAFLELVEDIDPETWTILERVGILQT